MHRVAGLSVIQVPFQRCIALLNNRLANRTFETVNERYLSEHPPQMAPLMLRKTIARSFGHFARMIDGCR